ncbi:DNA breaking-rejoining protein, partial [Escherichia coli]|nr:DNA breaking-rejoining protein [Escherichia coli]
SAPSGATAGTAVITVTTDDGAFTATHTVTVTV